jgi:hypothetical protein
MGFSSLAFSVFEQAIEKYHELDQIDQEFTNPYPKSDEINHLLYRKNWIDTVQWHLEDIIRDPEIDPVKGMKIKRTIDASNQDRTDMVEYIDSYFLNKFKDVEVKPDAGFNTESPAWAIDRLSILALKIYHMEEEANRPTASKEHRESCNQKLGVLLEQKNDLFTSIDQLIQDISSGAKYMKVYKQMKMYNDEELNPVLYRTRK